MEATPPPLANAYRQAKYSLRFPTWSRHQKILLNKEKSILLGFALNEQAAGLASVLFRSRAKSFPLLHFLPARWDEKQFRELKKSLPLPHRTRARARLRNSLLLRPQLNCLGSDAPIRISSAVHGDILANFKIAQGSFRESRYFC